MSYNPFKPLPKRQTRYLFRCPESGYEHDFKSREAAENLIAQLHKEDSTCQEPHEVIEQIWQEGRWVDKP